VENECLIAWGYQRRKGEVVEEDKKVYIGNLAYEVAEGDIASALEEAGLTAKSISVIMDRQTGRSKGFGFAEFETKEAAEKAIESLNGKEIKGRAVKVNKAQKMQPRSDKFGGRGGGGGGYDRGSRY